MSKTKSVPWSHPIFWHQDQDQRALEFLRILVDIISMSLWQKLKCLHYKSAITFINISQAHVFSLGSPAEIMGRSLGPIRGRTIPESGIPCAAFEIRAMTLRHIHHFCRQETPSLAVNWMLRAGLSHLAQIWKMGLPERRDSWLF